MSDVKRSVTHSICDVYSQDEDLLVAGFEVDRKLNDITVIRAAKRYTGRKKVIIRNLRHKKMTYLMSLEHFIENADEIIEGKEVGYYER